MDRARYIVVEGPIGVGKTSLVNALIQRFNGRGVFEIVEENPFLPLFYQDRSKYGFQTQLFFLLSRFKQQQEIFQYDLFNQVTISDYMFAKDRIFASINLDPASLALYDRVFDLLGPRTVKPDLVVYLQARMDVLLARIKKRGREFEKKLDPAYLEQVCNAYNEFFFRYQETPLLVINTSDIDYVGNEADLDNIVSVIRKMKHGRQHYIPLGAHAQ